MPRLLPKLVEEVQRARARAIVAVESKKLGFCKGKSKPKQRATLPLVYLNQPFSFRGRNKSILLDTTNPILHRERFLRNKLELRKSVIREETGETKDGQQNVMSLAERGLSSNPYLRMLSSPIRQCVLTDKHLPTDFMIRLAILQVSSHRLTNPRLALLPDGLQHPRFRWRNGRGCYIMCYKPAIQAVCTTHQRKLRRIPSTVQIHSLLAEQIVSQLRNRVLQELELLTERLRCSPSGSRKTMVVRKLTRPEWDSIRSIGRLSQPGAIAILIVPPVQKQTLIQEPRNFQRSQLSPSSELYPTDIIPDYSLTGLRLPLSPNMIPVYNSIVLFPLPRLRHELHQRLQTLLEVERKARWRQATSMSHLSFKKDQHLKPKSSHAYIILADSDTVQRSDSIPLAVALWRLRLWEGYGWDASKGDYGGWTTNFT